MDKKVYIDKVIIGSVVQIAPTYEYESFHYACGIVTRTNGDTAEVIVRVPHSLHEQPQGAELTVKIEDFEYIGEAVYVPEHIGKLVEETRNQYEESKS